MTELQVGDADGAAVAAAQQWYASQCQVEANREAYRSPDGAWSLVLEFRREVPWGPQIFRATVAEAKAGRASRLTGEFLSPGRYGQGFDHWAGSPWSGDSQRVALVAVEDGPTPSFEVTVFDRMSRTPSPIASGPTVFLHHAWSPDSTHYLYRDLSAWYLHSFSTTRSSLVHRSTTFPKHCHFVRGGGSLLHIDDASMARLMDVHGLSVQAEVALGSSLRAGERIDYSLPDPAGDVVFVGLNATFGTVVRCERWLAVTAA